MFKLNSMETPLQTKIVNALFTFFKTKLFTVEQISTGFFNYKTTNLSLIPINEVGFSKINLKTEPLKNSSLLALLLLSLFFMGNTFGQTITTATGGSAISADTFGSSTFTTLTGPVYSEASNGNVGTGTIILNVPTGFIFDTGGTAPTVVVTRIGGGGNNNRNINDGEGTYAITSRTATQITFTVTAASSNGVTCSLTWQNIRVRPTAGSPLASGNLTKTGTSSMSGVTNSSTNFGTLTEVAGNATKLAFLTQPSSATYGTSLNPVVILQDQYNNPTLRTSGNLATLNVTMAIASGTGSVSGTTSLNIGTAGGNGTVSFSNLETTTIGAKTITASASGLTPITSSSFTISAAPLTITANNVNKTYGTAISSPGAGQTTFTLSGIQNSETVGSVTITYGTGLVATAAVGSYATVTPSLATGGTFTAANYTITYTLGNIIVGAKTLTIGAPTIASKAYDATTNAGAVTLGALSGFIGTETVTATATAANYSSANVGSYPGTVVAYTLANGLNGGLASNYSLANGSVTGTITAKVLTIGTPTIASKAYDATTTPGAVTLGTLSGFIGSQTVTATATAANYSSANVGSYPGTVVTYTLANGTNGGLATNYSLANGSAIGAITAKVLTIGTPTIASKAYDATTTAGVVSLGTLSGFIGTQTVTATATAANYSSANVGSYPGTVVTYTLANGANGGLASNYSLANSSATGAITAKALTIGLPTITSKPYDGTTTAGAVTLGALSGFIGTETVTATATAANYSSANVGSYPGVVVTYTLANGTNGGLAINYSLVNGSATGVITAGPFVRMQLLLPGETAAPGTPSGKTGTPTAQNTTTPFTVTVRAVDAFWNVVTTAPTNEISITSTDGAAIVPTNANLASGTRTFTITLRTPGSPTITATNVTNGVITANTSAPITVAAGIKTSVASGLWSASGTWSPSGQPYIFDIVRIDEENDITVAASATCASINFIAEDSKLIVNAGVILTVSGAVTLNSYNDDIDTSAEILGLGTLNTGYLNIGLSTVLNNDDGSDNTLVIDIAVLNVLGDITMYNNDEGDGEANRPELWINPPCVLTASKIAMIQTGDGDGGSRIITFDVDNGATVNLSGGPNPITISSEVDLESDHVDFDFDTSSTINFNGSVLQNIPALISNSRSGGSTDSSVPVNYGNLTITNTTGTTTATATGRTINIAGNLTNNGMFNATSSTVNFNGTGAQAIAGTTETTFDDVTIGKTGGTLSVNTNAIVGDDFTFTRTGATLSVPSPRVLTVTDVITVNTNTGGNSVASTVTGTGTINAGAVNVGTLPGDINSGSSAYTTTLTSTIADFTIANDIDLNSYRGNGNRRSNAVFNHASGTINLDGAVVITNQHANNTSTFSMATGAQAGVLNLANATPFSLSLVGISTVNLNGSAAVVEYLGSVPQTALGTTYRTLKINNSNTGVTLIGNATATTLDLTDGLVNTAANTMTVASGGSIVNASSNSYVNGKLARVLTTTATTTYPVGKGGVYSPVDFTYAAAPGTRTVAIEQFETGTPFSSAASLATFGSRYWNVTQSATGIGYRVGLNDSGNTAPSGSSVVILRRDNVTITANATNYSAPNYTNATAFNAANASNEVSLGVNNIPLSITGISGINTKLYDGNAIATAIGIPTLSGSISPGDIVSLSGTAVYTFNNKNVGTGKAVTVSGLTLSGANASGYSLPTLNQIPGLIGNITVRPITVTAVTNTKTYNGTTGSSGVPTYSLQSGDTTTTLPSQSFDTKDIGVNKTLTPSGLVINDGNGGNNYSISYAPVITGTINAKLLTVALVGPIDKIYDSTTAASITQSNFNVTGIVGSEDVTITYIGSLYNSRNFGLRNVTVSSLGLDGLDASNYSVPSSITGNNIGSINRRDLVATLQGAVIKQYDGNNTATLNASNYSLDDVQGSDIITVTNTNGTYDTSAIASGKNVTIVGLTLGGSQAANYNLTNASSISANIGEITQKALTVSIVANPSIDKIYNATIDAILTSSNFVLSSGVVSGEDVSVSNTSGVYNSRNVGTRNVTVTDIRIVGAHASNYIISNAASVTGVNVGIISKKEITITGATSQDRAYNGNTTSVVTGGSLIGVESGDIVNLTQSGIYPSKDVGGPYPIIPNCSISGTSSGNYNLIQPSLADASIIKKILIIVGITSNKTYDGNDIANITGGALVGVVGSEDVNVSFLATYSSKDAGGSYVITPNASVTGTADLNNYTWSQPVFTNRFILARPLTVTGISASDKIFDGNSIAVLDTSSAILNGVLSGETVSLNSGSAIGNFVNKNVGTGKTVNGFGFTIGGADVANYSIVQPSTIADISPLIVTVTANNQSNCAGSLLSFEGTEFTTFPNDSFIKADLLPINLTSTGNDISALAGSYPIEATNASGSGVGNYIISYINGTLVVNPTPTATITGSTSACLSDVSPLVTFTGANGTSRYRFTYKINGGSDLTVISPIASNIAIVPVSTTAATTFTYTLVGVEDVTTGCSQLQSGTATVTVGVCTSLVPQFRGTTLTDLNNVLSVIPITGATTYRYEVRNLTTNVVSVFERSDSNRTLLSLVQLQTAPASPLQTITYNTSYSVRVAINNNGFVYGAAYTVTTSAAVPSIRLSWKYCGSRLTALDEPFFANPVYNAVRYKFRVNGPGIVNEEFISNGQGMILTNLTQSPILYGTSYSVQVQASVDGTTYPTPYGQVCIINTPFDVPTSRIAPSLCGRTFSMRVGIQPLAVFGADAYFYEVSGGNLGSPVGLEVTNMANPVFVFNNVPGATLNQTYSVRVSVRINGVYPTTNGIDRLFGSSCTLSTGAAKMSDDTIITNVFEVKAFPNPFASHFNLEIESSSDALVQVKVYDMIGRQLEANQATVSELSTREIGRNYPSGVYNVILSQGNKIKSIRMVKR